RSDLAVESLEYVEIEFRGDALAVVIRPFEDPFVLDEIDANKKPASLSAPPGDVLHEAPRRRRGEVADSRARIIYDLTRIGEIEVGELDEPGVVGVDGFYPEVGIIVGERLYRIYQVLFGYIYRHVSGGVLKVIQKEPDFPAAPAPELNKKAVFADRIRDRAYIVPHYRTLGTGEVILVERANLVEERRALLVVEELAGELLLPGFETLHHLVNEGLDFRLVFFDS